MEGAYIMGATRNQKNHVLSQGSRKAFITAAGKDGHDLRTMSTLQLRAWVAANPTLTPAGWTVPKSAAARDDARALNSAHIAPTTPILSGDQAWKAVQSAMFADLYV